VAKGDTGGFHNLFDTTSFGSISFILDYLNKFSTLNTKEPTLLYYTTTLLYPPEICQEA